MAEQVYALRIDNPREDGAQRVSVTVRRNGEVVYLWIHDPETKDERLYTMTVVDWERLSNGVTS